MNNKIGIKYLASLIVITDDGSEDCNRFSYILNLFTLKLKKLNIFLRKIFFITKQDYADIVQQMTLLMHSNSNNSQNHNEMNWILMTTTNSLNDHLMNRVLEDAYKNEHTHLNGYTNGKYSVVDEKQIFLLRNKSFHSDMLSLMNHLIKNRNQFVLQFENKLDLLNFTEKLESIFHVKYDYFAMEHSTTQEITIRRNFTNYSKYSIELILHGSENLKLIRTKLSDELVKFSACSLLMDYGVNSDSYLYEFDFNNFNYQSADIIFLRSKVNYEEFKLKIKQTIDAIEQALKKYDTNQLCISFNGGKDCCVVLYMFYAVCIRMGARFPLNVLLIKIQHQFEEMKIFLDKTITHYYGDALEFIVFDEDSKTLKDCLRDLKETKPIVSGILMGTRRTDNAYFKNMNTFAPTDGDWPKFMRINPILDWSYSEIWLFIRLLKLPYCSLYDRGYTSLDNTINTVPNNDLVREDGSYMPAYWLENQDAERKSRKKN